ncbi:MAG: endoribonuclease YicC domain-containing protein [bacterium]
MKSLISMRAEEGKEISKQLKIHLDNIQKYLSRLIELLPEEAKEYRRRLESRIIGMLGEKITIDEYRLIHEIAILAEKADVTEETARLKSHLRQLTQWLQLKKEKGIGKKLDFILQEINREINTIGSKSNHLDIARLVIELKNETEMIREQVQNIE